MARTSEDGWSGEPIKNDRPRRASDIGGGETRFFSGALVRENVFEARRADVVLRGARQIMLKLGRVHVPSIRPPTSLDAGRVVRSQQQVFPTRPLRRVESPNPVLVPSAFSQLEKRKEKVVGYYALFTTGSFPVLQRSRQSFPEGGRLHCWHIDSDRCCGQGIDCDDALSPGNSSGFESQRKSKNR